MTDRSRTPGATGADIDPPFEGDTNDQPGGPQPSGVAEDMALVLASQRAELEAAVAEQKDKYLRLAAEFDNFRKRASRDRENAEYHGQTTVLRGLLDALDDLARFAHLDATRTDSSTVIDGAAMVEQKLLKSLAGHGLELINPAGRPFDPAVHEAVATAAAESKDEDHVVSQVYQVGYLFKGQLLRPARVVVKQWGG